MLNKPVKLYNGMYGILNFTWAQKTSALQKVDHSMAIEFLVI